MQTLHVIHTWLVSLGGTPAPQQTASPAMSPTGAPRVPEQHGGGVGLPWLVLTALLGVATGAGALWYTLRNRLTGGIAPPAFAGGTEAARAWDAGAKGRAWNGSAPSDEGDRDVLIRGLIDLADRLRDSDKAGLWKAANRHLAAAGVEPHIADGEAFDPVAHRAGGYEPTSLPQSHLTVASTEEAGYTDRGRVIRRPKVIVYRVVGDDRVG